MSTGNWVLYALITLVFWGLWGFLYKVAGATISPKDVMVYSILGSVLSYVAIIAVVGLPDITASRATTYAFLGGFIGALGGLTFLFAVQQGKISVVTPLTALYPIVTIVLGILVLHESISLQKALGIVFAAAAMFLLGL